MSRVLVADDNPPSLLFFEDALRSLGHDTVAVADGPAALLAAHESPFDVLLLDARMPNLGGAETWLRIRDGEGPSRRACPIATTADDSAGARMDLLEAGFVEVLVKPLTLIQLRLTLATHARPSAQWRVADGDGMLDDRQAMAAGGDATVMTALRTLLVGELEALPAEIAALSERRDADALRERLHRLDASAGFCGAPALSRAAQALRVVLDGPAWPSQSVEQFLASCDHVRNALAP